MASALGTKTGTAGWLKVMAGLSTEQTQQVVILPPSLSTGWNTDGDLLSVVDAVPVHH